MRSKSFGLYVCTSAALLWASMSGASAQVQCTMSGNDVSCTNSGNAGNNASIEAATANGGNATLTNYGTAGDGSVLQAVTFNGGNATLTNYGSVGSNSQVQAFTFQGGNATLTNYGTIGRAMDVEASTIGGGNATLINYGSIGGAGGGFVRATTSNQRGNAYLYNYGNISANTIQADTSAGGSATFANFGNIQVGSVLQVRTNNGGDATVFNSGSVVGTNAMVQVYTFNSGANATLTNAGSFGPNTNIEVAAFGTGNATFNNYGITSGSVSVIAMAGTANLSNHAGSLIVGSISLTGPTRIVEFFGGNYTYTLNSLAGVQINAHGAPYAVSGNTVAVLDPTGLALEDRSLMNFTGGVSSLLQDRFRGMGIAGGVPGAATPLGFAPQTSAADRVGAAHDAFAGLPSLSMSYASDDSKARNARAMYTKVPPAAPVPVNDITVWTSGFGGERQQLSYGPIQAARDSAYGGVIGIDRQFSPDWRFGLFAGGGASRLRSDFNVQNVDSTYGFGGGYGRYDRRDYYVDFALFGGGISSNSSRSVANNLVGFETATAGYNGWFISPDVTAGYRVFTNWGVVTPKARVRYVGASLDGYTETGSAQGLGIGSRSLSDAEERLGLELSTVRPALFGPGTVKLSGEIDAVGLQRLGDNTINAVLLAQNVAFTTPGKARAYGAAASGSLDWRPRDNVSLYVSAEGMSMDDRSYSVVGKGGVRVGF